MKLYYSSGACSLAPHIALIEAGLRFDLESVDLKAKKTASGKDFNAINEKGYVPFLDLGNGEALSEVAAIQQYIADLKPEKNLAPKAGTLPRAHLNEWLTFISTEIHKGFAPLWANLNPQSVEAGKNRLYQRFDYIEKKLKGRDYLTGDQFTVADAYLFTVLNWANFHKLDMSKWPTIQAYSKRVAARPAVQEAMRAEGLLKAAA